MLIDTENKECTESSHVFRIIKMKDNKGKEYKDIPDNMCCTCGKMQYGDIVK